MPPTGTAPLLTADDIKAALDADPRLTNWRRQLFEPVALRLPTILASVLADQFTLESLIRTRLLVVNYLATDNDYLKGVGGLPCVTKEAWQTLLGRRTMELNTWLDNPEAALQLHHLTEEQAINMGPPTATYELMAAWRNGHTIADATLTQISYILMVT